ncbi:MAG: hypothetical protein N3A54_05310, partial [Patescibacteria group bacterium]|nr:hypothetical protein [Patescibacteria group bacterium]
MAQNKNPGYVSPTEALEEEQIALEWTLDETKKYVEKASNLLRIITDYYHGLLEGTKQHHTLYKNNLKKIEEELEVLREYGRSIFSSELEKTRLQFQEKMAKEVLDSVTRTSEPINKFKNFLTEFMALPIAERKKYGDIGNFVRLTRAEHMEEFKASVRGIEKLAKEYYNYSGRFVKNHIMLFQDYEEQSEELLKLLGTITKAQRESIKVSQKEAQYQQEKDASSAVKSGMNAFLESSLKVKNLQEDWLYKLYYAKDVSTAVRESFRDILNSTNLMLNAFKTTWQVQKDMIASMDKIMSGYIKGGGLYHRDAEGFWSSNLYEGVNQARKFGITEEKVSLASLALQNE